MIRAKLAQGGDYYVLAVNVSAQARGEEVIESWGTVSSSCAVDSRNARHINDQSYIAGTPRRTISEGGRGYFGQLVLSQDR